jgi:outer membrane protein TolC
MLREQRNRKAFEERAIMKLFLKRAGSAAVVMWLSIGLARSQSNSQRQAATSPTSTSGGVPQNSSQNPFLGSVPVGTPTSEVLPLSITDAVDRGLRQNLGLLMGNDTVTTSRGQLWENLSELLPHLSAGASEHAAQEDLAEQGFQKLISRFPGFPLIIGPFGYFELHGDVSQSLLDIHALNNARSAQRSLDAAKLSYQDLRELVVLVVGVNYLQAISSSARVDTAEAQLQTAQALYNQAVDLKRVGASAGIDLLRAQVELQSRQQERIAARNDFAKQKLALARVIGLPLGQEFMLTDSAPFEAATPATLDDLLQQAYATRADFQSAQTQVRAAEYAQRSVKDEHLPTLTADAEYGLAGPTPGQTHGVFSASASLNVPIFMGNRVRGDAMLAQAELDRDRQRVDDLRAQIEQDVRDALLDLQSAGDLVNVAKSNVGLAQQALTESRDRFQAGATDNLEVVQAQDSVATANESYISSLYAYNLARVRLARATGNAERGIRQYWKEK